MPTLANMQNVNGITIAAGADVTTDRHILLGTQTASSSATLSFSGINSHRSDVLRSSFDVLEFHMVNIHAATDAQSFGFQFNADGASGFNETITSTAFKAEQHEGDAASGMGYNGGEDQAQGTAYQRLTYNQQIDNDEAYSGVLTLYAPSSTTYVKHFVANGNYVHHSGHYSQNLFAAGYVNTTSALDEISFKMESGNIDAGVIKMYGIAKA